MFISAAYSFSGIRVLIIVGVIQAVIDVYWCCVFCFWNEGLNYRGCCPGYDKCLLVLRILFLE